NAPAGHFYYSPIALTNTYKSYNCTFIARNIPPGLYTVTGQATDNGSPTGESEGSVYIRTHYDVSLDGIQELNANGFRVYPNPANDHLSIDLANNAGADVQIINTLGQTMFSSHISGTHTEIITSSLDNGIYFLSLKNADGSVKTVKFVKQ
ncbi:MAG TPA: T9SS type A sorting domain-containing protein, partial [Bacteroidia bacterium]|nr:T9SS type A sorting domain-containing protein [Bacteroidia bacterium]